MIRHLLRLIWNQRRQNGWLWAELLLVSVFLWFLVDYLYVMGRTYTTPLGFDIEHTYQIGFGDLSDSNPDFLSKEERAPGDTDGALLLDLLERIRAYPGVEEVCYSDAGIPYTQGTRFINFQVDSLERNCRWMKVSPDYFTVFRVRDREGRTEPLVEALRKPQGAVFSEGFGQDDPDFNLSLGQEIVRMFVNDHFKLNGICQPVRRSEYERAEPVAFLPITASTVADGYYDGEMNSLEICFRVRPEVDDAGFAARFRKDMAKQARIGNIYMLDVTPMSDLRTQYIRSTGVENEVKTRVAVACFLLVNIFLGIIGTFWFRTEYRKGEMGLRMALGSTRRQLNSIMMGEGILLLILAFVPSLVISFNIATMDLVDSYLLPFTWLRFAICEGITFTLIVCMIICGVWYPARTTARLEPAEALHYE